MDNPIRLHWLDPKDPAQSFPPVSHALRDPNGLLAIGGDLSTSRLLRAYRAGIFPWFNPDEPVLWWSPDPRTVLPTNAMYASRRLQRSIRRADYAVTLDHAPARVLAECAAPRDPGQGTWLGMQMQQAYLALTRLHALKSIEIWRDGELIGGLYGVTIGRMLFGESMFSRATNGSKIAVYWLCRTMQSLDMPLLDCQVHSQHLETLGAIQVPRAKFIGDIESLSRDVAPNWKLPEDAPADTAHLPPC